MEKFIYKKNSKKFKSKPRPRREIFSQDIDLKKANLIISELQLKIVQKLKDYGYQNIHDLPKSGIKHKLNHLRDILLKSKSARILAVYKVISNKGFRSKGFSPEIPLTNSHYKEMIDKLKLIIQKPWLYKATPLQRIYILKADGVSKRPLSIPTYFDRSLQALFHLYLDVINEFFSDKNSYGFRKARSPLHGAEAIRFHLVSPKQSVTHALEIDIKGCFDNISHEFLLNNMPMNRHILKQWCICGYINLETPETLYPTEAGIPQGGIISPTLCNLTLNGLENLLHDKVNEKFYTKKSHKAGANKGIINFAAGFKFVRFADDMVALCRSAEVALFAKEIVIEFLTPRGLEIKEAKTKITDLSCQSFDFLGFTFYRYKNFKKGANDFQFYNRPTKKNIQKIKDKLREILVTYKYDFHRIIQESNPIIRGFCQYYRYGNSSQDISNLTRFIKETFYIHLRKNAHEIRKNLQVSDRIHTTKDFVRENFMYINAEQKINKPSQGKRKNPSIYWFKCTSVDYETSKEREIKLEYPTRFTHKKVFTKAGLNYYDPENRNAIFELNKNLSNQDGRKGKILSNNGYCCYICNINLQDEEVEYEIHHIKPKQFFLNDRSIENVSNLIPLCKTCHNKVTNAVKKLFQGNRDHIIEFLENGIIVLPDYILKEYKLDKKYSGN